MRLLEQKLIEEVTDYVLLDEPFPIDLMVKLEEAGFIIEELRQSILSEYIHKGA